MLKNEDIKEGFKNNPYHREKSRTGKVFSWVGCPEGRVAKTIIGIIGDNQAPRSVVITRAFAKSGATKERLYEGLHLICPWISDVYLASRGVPLKPEIVSDRYYNMYYENSIKDENGNKIKEGEGKVSREHWLQDDRLRIIAPHVYEFAHFYRPITLEQAIEIGKIQPNG